MQACVCVALWIGKHAVRAAHRCGSATSSHAVAHMYVYVCRMCMCVIYHFEIKFDQLRQLALLVISAAVGSLFESIERQ